MTAFGDFIIKYINSHSLSLNKFAQQMGTSHTTLDRWIDGKTEPTIKQLLKLSSATATDVCEIVYLLHPEARPHRRPEVTRLADEIAALPPNMQELVDSLIVGMVVKQRNDNPNKS